MKKYILYIVLGFTLISCQSEEDILEQKTLKFQTITSGFALAKVKNTFDTIINTDTIKTGSNSYKWDELDYRGLQVANGLYIITVYYKESEIASGSYVVGQ